MESKKAKTNILLKKLATKMIYHEIEGWPPDCMGFVYQPKRPNRQARGSQSSKCNNHTGKNKNI